MGDQLMGFPTPLEVFGESRQKKSRKPPPIGSGGSTPIGSPHHQSQMQQRVNSAPQPAQQYYPPPVHPQLQQQQPHRVNYPPPQQQQQQAFRPPVPVHTPSRHSSQPSLHSVHSNHSNPSVQYRSPIVQQQPVLQEQQQQPFGPRSKKEIFEFIDRDHSGTISFKELANGLLNKDGSKFTLRATSSIFKLFDSNESQSLSYNEFSRLFDCLDRWKTCFVMADKNESSSLSFSEFQDALQVLGYRLSTDTALYVFQTFSGANLELKFDMFIESCVYLIGITRVFKKFDPQGNGVAVIQFENFVEEVLKIKTRT